MENRTPILPLISLIKIIRPIPIKMHPHQSPRMLRRTFMSILIPAVNINTIPGLNIMLPPPVSKIPLALLHRKKKIRTNILPGTHMRLHTSQSTNFLHIKIMLFRIRRRRSKHPIRQRLSHHYPFPLLFFLKPFTQHPSVYLPLPRPAFRVPCLGRLCGGGLCLTRESRKKGDISYCFFCPGCCPPLAALSDERKRLKVAK